MIRYGFEHQGPEADYRFIQPGYAPHERRLQVLRMRALGMTFEEIGGRFGVSGQRARQIYEAALRLRRRQREVDPARVAALEIVDWLERHPKRTLAAMLAIDLLAGGRHGNLMR